MGRAAGPASRHVRELDCGVRSFSVKGCSGHTPGRWSLQDDHRNLQALNRKVTQSGGITRDSAGGAPILSRRVPYAVHLRGALTGHFVGSVARRSHDGREPPPPLKRWSARLVPRAQAPDQRFRVRSMGRKCRLSGLFLGTYSPVPYAAPCRLAPRTRPVRCRFAVESLDEVKMRRAARGMPYATALLNVSRSSNGVVWRGHGFESHHLGGGASKTHPLREAGSPTAWEIASWPFLPAETKWRGDGGVDRRWRRSGSYR